MLSRARLPGTASVVLGYRETSVHTRSDTGMLTQGKRVQNATRQCSSSLLLEAEMLVVLSTPPMPTGACRIPPVSPSQYPSGKLMLFWFFCLFFFNFWISFLMVWCIESVNERASLALQPAQERWEPAAGGACTKEKGEKRGRSIPHFEGVAKSSRYLPSLPSTALCGKLN